MTGQYGKYGGYIRTYAEIDLDAILLNMEHMKQNLAPGTRMMAVIKTDGYGHGANPAAQVLEPLPYVQGFAVATAEEALLLRQNGVKKPILVLGYTFPCSYRELIGQDVRQTVFREDNLLQLAETASQAGKKAKVHIKVDTGMSRIGIRPDDTGIAFVKKALSCEAVEVEGIFTHFARADEADKTSANLQLELFLAFLGRIEAECGYRAPLRHCSNSAGIVELPQANLDLVRAGITMYGLWPSGEVSQDIVALKPALSWYSTVVYCKECAPGTAVSYGGTYVLKEPMRVATIPVGYGDGYPRSLSNRGYVLIRGKRAPILGRICMDQFMVDVTQIPQAGEGDRVTLIGSDGMDTITAEQLGGLAGRFNYELVCCIGKRVPRIYLLHEQAAAVQEYCGDKAGFRILNAGLWDFK